MKIEIGIEMMTVEPRKTIINVRVEGHVFFVVIATAVGIRTVTRIISIRIVRADSKYKPAIEGTILEAAFAIDFMPPMITKATALASRIPNNHPLSAKKLLSPPVMDKN